MKRSPYPAQWILLLAAFHGARSDAQATPNVQGASSYQGFHLPTVGGTMSYSVTLSGDVGKGYNGANGASGFTTISGNLALLTGSKRHPFSMVYSGGYFADVTGNQPSTVYQNLALSQVLTRGRWTYTVSDSISYLPQTATTGLSGVPGVGDTGTAPVDVGAGTGPGVLTNNQTRIADTVIGSAQRRLTASTSLAGTASYSFSRFLGSSVNSASALNSDQSSGALNLSHRVDARNTVGASYSYFHISYPGTLDPSTQTILGLASSVSANSFVFNYTRLVSRRLSVFVSAGPQLTSFPNIAAASSTTTGTATSLNATVTAGLTYTTRGGTAAITYSRGTNAGSGVVTGANTDTLQVNASRRLSRVWNSSASVGYNRSTSLVALTNDPFVSNGLSATGQINRSVGRHLSAFGSYTAQRQSFQGAAVTSAVFNGLNQTVAVGITYSPGTIGRIRR